MNTEAFERLIGQTKLRSNSKAEIIQLNRSEKAFIDEDKKSIELAEAIFAENNMFHFRKPGPARLCGQNFREAIQTPVMD